MNRPLNDLMYHAGLTAQGCWDSMDEYDRQAIEKFAELIVKECLSIVKSNTYGPNGEYDYSYSDESAAADERAETIYKEIAYSFGVEE